MLYLYDKALCDDLEHSFNPNNVPDPLVRVIDPEGSIDILAAMKEDRITYPFVSVFRHPDSPIDTTRRNFTRMHKGVPAVIDNEKNLIYYEKVLPIELKYDLSVFTTNMVDMDEILRELQFKYIETYFLTITLPYEASRKIRFGVRISEDGIERQSGTVEYVKSGHLHKAKVPLVCEGCVLVDYTPAKLRRTEFQVEPVNPQ